MSGMFASECALYLVSDQGSPFPPDPSHHNPTTQSTTPQHSPFLPAVNSTVLRYQSSAFMSDSGLPQLIKFSITSDTPIIKRTKHYLEGDITHITEG